MSAMTHDAPDPRFRPLTLTPRSRVQRLVNFAVRSFLRLVLAVTR